MQNREQNHRLCRQRSRNEKGGGFHEATVCGDFVPVPVSGLRADRQHRQYLPGGGRAYGRAEKAEPIGESFRIIQEKPDWLLLAKEEGGSAEVYTLSLRDVELTLDGRSLRTERAGGLSALS